ncbi:hypothetical protein CR969_01465 [Candidatus Saccharibacteria bacterium]|nr:MAG: hypothetical protein CR969_01465 [Candidatus Saccharibacteria bacterium]
MEKFSGFNNKLRVLEFSASLVEIGLRDSFKLSFVDIVERPSVLIKVAIEDVHSGVSGVGFAEGVGLPLPLFTDDCSSNMKDNAIELMNYMFEEGDFCGLAGMLKSVQRYKFGSGGNFPAVRLAAEAAILDSFSRLCGISVSNMLGVVASSEVPYGKSISASSVNDMLHQSRLAIKQGASKMKLKVMPENINEVVETIKGLRDSYPNIGLMVDANGGFDPTKDEHIDALKWLDSMGLLMIEEPVSRSGPVRGLDSVELMRQKIPELLTPICLDDCLLSYDDCVYAIDSGLADVINIKPSRIGSVVGSIDLIDLCYRSNKQLMVGGMLEATPGRCLNAVLSAYCILKGFAIPGDLSLPEERLKMDIEGIDSCLRYGPGGGVVLCDGLGWGYNYDHGE